MNQCLLEFHILFFLYFTFPYKLIKEYIMLNVQGDILQYIWMLYLKQLYIIDAYVINDGVTLPKMKSTILKINHLVHNEACFKLTFIISLNLMINSKALIQIKVAFHFDL